MKDFIVLDTEGKADQLSEIAVVNSHGQLIYEAFVQGHLNNDERRINVKPLPNILADFLTLAQTKLIVCHFAEHDINVLKHSFQRAAITWPTSLTFACSFELAKAHLPRLSSYSLEYLSRHLNLKVENHYFNPNFAHAARYDAAFTYQLYLTLRPPPTMLTTLKEKLQNLPDPFSSSRVDTPFQNHLDLADIYQQEFELLTTIIHDIKLDNNHQSKGAVVIGEAGSGKTHLMMRLAKELLKSNRLLFIRQPNHPEAVLYHTYSRILESLVEVIPGTPYSQIEYLLAKSFSKIVINILTKKTSLTKKEEGTLDILSKDSLNIYQVFDREKSESEKKRENWQLIERHTLAWWAKTYGFEGYSVSLVKGLIKFCSYSDPRRRECVRKWLAGNELEQEDLKSIGLNQWTEELNREEFALEAMAVFGKLSLADEPLIIIFDQLEGLKSQKNLLFNFGEAVKEIFTHVPNSLIILNLFPDRWKHFQQFFNAAVIDRVSQYQVVLNQPPVEKLKEILALRLQSVEVTLTELFTEEELPAILEAPAIRGVLNWASYHYRHKVYDAPLPSRKVSGPEGSVVTQRNESNFELEIRTAIKQLQADIAWLKQTIHLEKSVLPSPMEKVTDKVSTDHPVLTEEERIIVDYLQQQQEILAQEYEKKIIIADSDDLGKLITIAETFKQVRQFETDCLRLGKKKLPEHLLIKTPAQTFVVGFLQCDGQAFTSRLKNFSELVITHQEFRFGLFRDQRLPSITGKVGKEEMEKLNNSPNGKLRSLEKADRINFELMYKLIVGIQNRDLAVDLKSAMDTLESYLKEYWLIKIFQKAARL